MFSLLRLVTILIPTLILGIFFQLISAPDYWWLVLFPLVILASGSIYIFVYKYWPLKKVIFLIFLINLFVLSSFTFYLFIETKLVMLILGLTIASLIFYLLNQLFLGVYVKKSWTDEIYLQTYLFYSILTIYFFVSSIFGLVEYLNLPVILSGLIVCLVIGLVVAAWLNLQERINNKPLFLIASVLVSLELYFSLLLLPLVFFEQGFIFTCLTLSALLVFLQQFTNQISRVFLKKSLIILIILLLLVLTTAKWS